MIRLISYGIVGASRAALAASWLALATAGAANADDFDHGFTAYLGGNYTQSFRVWRPLAEAGEVEAQFGLGLLYAAGGRRATSRRPPPGTPAPPGKAPCAPRPSSAACTPAATACPRIGARPSPGGSARRRKSGRRRVRRITQNRFRGFG